MGVFTRLVSQGAVYSIHAIVEGKRCPFETFFMKLEGPDKGKLRALFNFIAEKGPPRNETKFKHEDDDIYAIKLGQIRVYCFFDAGRMIVVTHGTIKKKQKANPEDLKRAKRLRDEYLKATKA